MPNIASQNQLEDYLGKPRDTMDINRANAMLSMATSALSAELGYNPAYVAGDILYMRGPRTENTRVLLAGAPVANVISIEAQQWDQLFHVVDAGSYVWTSDGWVNLIGFTPWTGSTTWRVTYDHGYTPATMPTPLRDMCVSVAGRLLTAQPGVLREDLGTYRIIFDKDAGVLTQSERDILSQFAYISIF